MLGVFTVYVSGVTVGGVEEDTDDKIEVTEDQKVQWRP